MEPIGEPYTPCIGILAIDVPPHLTARYGTQWHSYISGGLSKWLESGGAFTVPIWIGRDRAYYRHMMSLVNGILLPGGVVPLTSNKDNPALTNEYIQSAYYIYDLALELNQGGKYFPLWGTCLGFQLLLMHAAKDTDMRTPCVYIRGSNLLELTKDFRKSTVLRELPKYLEEELKQIKFACHNHKFFVSKEAFDEWQLSKDYQILATRQHEESGQTIVMFVEHRCLPLFGSQFHPERVAFEQVFALTDTCKLSHSKTCVEMSQYLGNTFVEFCRRNTNRFATTEQISRHILYNWPPTFTGKYREFRWLQAYFFEKNVDYPRGETAEAPCGCLE